MIGNTGISVGNIELVQGQQYFPAQWAQFQLQLLPFHTLQKLLIVNDGELFLQLKCALWAKLHHKLLRLPQWFQHHQLLAIAGICRGQVTRLSGIDVATQQAHFGCLRHKMNAL